VGTWWQKVEIRDRGLDDDWARFNGWDSWGQGWMNDFLTRLDSLPSHHPLPLSLCGSLAPPSFRSSRLAMNSPTSSREMPSNLQLLDMAREVLLVCCDKSLGDILQDLAMTRSSEITINRIFDGQVMSKWMHHQAVDASCLTRDNPSQSLRSFFLQWHQHWLRLRRRHLASYLQRKRWSI